MKVAIIGLGYVGLPTAIAAARAGLNVIGIDVNKSRVADINRGKSFISEIPSSVLKQSLKNFRATTDWGALKTCNVILIAVPTPLTKNKTPDTSAIENAAHEIAKYLRRGMLVVLESTTYPGTTDEVLKPILEKSGLKAGRDFFLAFAPERIDPGNKKFGLTDVTKVVGGINPASTQKAAAFYKLIWKKVHTVSSARAAEMTKLHENIFRLVNISLVNELKLLADKMGIDFWEVIEAAKTKPYGFMPFYPGPGVGGHCIAIDPFYLTWKAREYNFFTRFIDVAGEVNELMPHFVATKIIVELNRKSKPVRGSKILILGVAYKKDVDDIRESAAIPLVTDLLRKGAKIFYNDPHIPHIEIAGKNLRSSPLTKALLQKMDCAVIITDHSAYDYRVIAQNSKLLIDTRNAVKQKSPNILL